MKTIPEALAVAYAKRASTICPCLKVTRQDEEVFGFTSLDRAIVVDDVEYIPGFDVSSLASAESLSVDNMELTILPDDQLPAQDLLSGRWNGAAFEIFEVDWTNIEAGVNILKRGTMGEATLRGDLFVVEFRSLTQALQQQQTKVTQKTCRARLGDAECGKDLSDFTVTGTLTEVTSRKVITDESRSEDEGYFADGIITFTSGANAGFSRKVKVFASGEFELSLALPFDAEVGDEYTAVAGCDKTLDTCRDKYSNVIRFRGEPHLPGLDALSRSPVAVDQPESTPNVPDFGTIWEPGEAGP